MYGRALPDIIANMRCFVFCLGQTTRRGPFLEIIEKKCFCFLRVGSRRGFSRHSHSNRVLVHLCVFRPRSVLRSCWVLHRHNWIPDHIPSCGSGRAQKDIVFGWVLALCQCCECEVCHDLCRHHVRPSPLCFCVGGALF